MVHAQKIEAIGILAGGIAHDFNNMLTVIIGFTEMLLQSHDLDETVSSGLGEIKKAANRASSLTQQLFAFSRTETPQLQAIHLNSLIANIAKILRPIIGADIAFQTRLDPNLGAIMADPFQIEVAIITLVVNARDALPHGGTISIETSNAVIDESYVRHLGEENPGAFELPAISDDGSGLSTVCGIIQQSGGFIRVYGEPGPVGEPK